MSEPVLIVTDAAAEKIISAKSAEGSADVALRVAAHEEGAKVTKAPGNGGFFVRGAMQRGRTEPVRSPAGRGHP